MNITNPFFSQITFLLSSIAKNNNGSSSMIRLLQSKQRILFSSPSSSSSPQDTIKTPSEFIEQIHSKTHARSCLYLFTLCLIKKLESTKAFTQQTQTTFQGIFFTCFCLAFKYMEDEVYSDADFATIGGFKLSSHVQRELHYLQALKFNVTVTLDEIKIMHDTIRTSKPEKIASCTCLSDLFNESSSSSQPKKNISQKRGFRFTKYQSEKKIFRSSKSLSPFGSTKSLPTTSSSSELTKKNEQSVFQSGGVFLVIGD
eukprot:c17940_g1_i1.p1 GENE.c17940_g1_i1~~c17940_g1_i1.p1  ORF type:complete len:257 (-),score=94.98 c17940_g1_i1:100-870(-)